MIDVTLRATEEIKKSNWFIALSLLETQRRSLTEFVMQHLTKVYESPTVARLSTSPRSLESSLLLWHLQSSLYTYRALQKLVQHFRYSKADIRYI